MLAETIDQRNSFEDFFDGLDQLSHSTHVSPRQKLHREQWADFDLKGTLPKNLKLIACENPS